MQGELERDHPLMLGIGVGILWILFTEAVLLMLGLPVWMYFVVLVVLWLAGPIAGMILAAPTPGALALVRVWGMGFPVALLFGIAYALGWYLMR